MNYATAPAGVYARIGEYFISMGLTERVQRSVYQGPNLTPS